MKKKLLIALSIVLAIALAFNVCLFFHDRVTYKEIPGYEKYISDRNTGVDGVPYFGTSIYAADDEAYSYYKENAYRFGFWLVTDYEEGVCINRYYGWEKIIDIPETIGGKPVVKLGSYYEVEEGNGSFYYDKVSAFSDNDDCILNIPSTVKYIEDDTVYAFSGLLDDETAADSPYITGINVDSDNPYYCSEKGVIYSKDKSDLLFLHLSENETEYTISASVDNIQLCDGLHYDWEGCLVFECRPSEINAVVTDGEFGLDDVDSKAEAHFTVKGYKGTEVEKWAEKYGIEFIPLD